MISKEELRDLNQKAVVLVGSGNMRAMADEAIEKLRDSGIRLVEKMEDLSAAVAKLEAIGVEVIGIDGDTVVVKGEPNGIRLTRKREASILIPVCAAYGYTDITVRSF